MSRVLEAREVTFRYDGSRLPVVEGWSGSFQAGTMTAIMGESGSGKSTLMFLLGLMLRVESGLVLLDEHPVSSLPDARRSQLRATEFGYIFQDSMLDPRRTVLDNVTQSAVFRGERPRDLHSRARRLLESLEVTVPIARRPGQVSGGQAQRIALCRALLHDPAVVLADEPTGNLDAHSAAVVVDELGRRAHSGAIVLIVTHSPDVAARCDTTVVLNERRAG